jgi:hypothetical protein
MAEINYRSIPNGGILKTLESGLQIIRRTKHEWLPSLQFATPAELHRFTDKIRGSKFTAIWTLPRYVQWKGKPVNRIKIELSSRCIHAYPVED